MDDQFYESSAQAAAATKIQALVRGIRSREQVNDYITKLIEELLRSKKERKTRQAQKQYQSIPMPITDVQVVAPYNEGVVNQQYQNKNTIDDEAEFEEEEELVVLIDGDDDCDDDDCEEIETIVEIVTFVDCEDEKEEKIEKKLPVLIEKGGGIITKVQNRSEGLSTDIPTMTMTKDSVTNKNKNSVLVLGGGGNVKTTKFDSSKKQLQEEQEQMISQPIIQKIPVVTTKMAKNTQSLPPLIPPTPTRRRHKSALVNRYLEAAVRPRESGSGGSSSSSSQKSVVVIEKLDIDGSKLTNNKIHEIEELHRFAEIEKDRNRSGAVVTARFSNRRQGTKPNDGENIIDSTQQQLQQQKKKESGMKEDESKEDSDKYYDETERLPLWWMEFVPHDTYNVEECDNENGKDNDNPMGEISARESTIIDIVYRPLRTKGNNFTRQQKTAVVTSLGD
mmetsp:Transcript_43501/g.49011  ORF Transcript_43501/g.49011 Transcript_43501/m.49011 type:complete len:449 (+) Transcript_43501:119-1465(+)